MNNSEQQHLANLIQLNEQIVNTANLIENNSVDTKHIIESARHQNKEVKSKLKELFNIDYDSKEASTQIMKEGSIINVRAENLHSGKEGGKTFKINNFSLPAVALLNDEGSLHKWFVNDEIEIA
ncbi:MAG: hypothetical protein COA67_09665 [Lutibacter sp.]|nr:MAG: hypothetical protein COA67_09665 [Lutibacter sp.]